MTTIEDRIKSLTDGKSGNKELALFYDWESQTWALLLGCTSPHTLLGEVPGEIETQGRTLREVIEKAQEVIERAHDYI